MWPFARLRLAGLSKEERSRPVKGWRLWLFHPLVWLLSRAVFLSMGFLWVKVKGRKADLKEAPVLVVAPHSGFLDMLVLFPTQLATVVSRSENTSLPVIGGEGLWLSWHTEDSLFLDITAPKTADGSINQHCWKSAMCPSASTFIDPAEHKKSVFVWLQLDI